MCVASVRLQGSGIIAVIGLMFCTAQTENKSLYYSIKLITCNNEGIINLIRICIPILCFPVRWQNSGDIVNEITCIVAELIK